MKRDLIILFAFLLISAAPVWTPLVTDSTLSGIGTEDSPLTIDTTKIATRYYSGSLTGGAEYLVYTALISQSGTDDPTATVLENTLGGTVVLSRTGVGQYEATLSGAFTLAKTLFIGLLNDGIASNSIAGYGASVNAVSFGTYESGVSTDELMTGASYIEIRVYP